MEQELKKEDDLILGKEEAGDESVADYYQDKEDIRADIDTAIYVYEFLDGLDEQAPNVLRWGMKRNISRAKKNCLKIIIEAVANLQADDENSEEEED
jgi:hypothetical protein